ncbi:hypothetical protein FSARC_731 [Fusarium sarcochroum]|uniref:Zn(2)-C6 fungal-type domain-containing protein n=1 Tax=Fusarium sarcochroum TaxID=1208366 RepID=A0A8H4UAN0_9HYPO|nr:hypothetical protein FSARC_731 [Fusarium sarcochroum]
MPKRPYRPKVKGCYECSQRRLNCDRGVPECQKCITKGVKCSGLGVRHRFSNGVASRGYCVGKTMDTAYPHMKKKTKPPVPGNKDLPENPPIDDPNAGNPVITPTESSSPSPLLFIHELVETNTFQFDDVDVSRSPDRAPNVFDDLPIVWDTSCEEDNFPFLNIENQQNTWLEVGETLPPCDEEPSVSDVALILPSPHPDHVPAWKRRLMLNFSDKIAGEMIAADGPHNGWRHLVLPIADRDELVMDAVLAVSLFHSPKILLDIPPTDRPEQDHYARAIQGLQKRSQLRDCDQFTRHSIILTILLLLTAVMVNGSSDFPILFGMLQSAIDAIGGDTELGSGGMADFLVRQVRKLKVYAAPLLSEDTGINVISSEAEVDKMFECLHHCQENNPQYSHSLGMVPDLVRQACEIYLNQVAFDSRAQSTPQVRARRVIESIRRVQHFVDTFEAFPENAPGKQVLVWACFVAASDCRLADHKEWFSNFFLSNYARSGFKNLTLGLDALRKVWARKPEERWMDSDLLDIQPVVPIASSEHTLQFSDSYGKRLGSFF